MIIPDNQGELCGATLSDQPLWQRHNKKIKKNTICRFSRGELWKSAKGGSGSYLLKDLYNLNNETLMIDSIVEAFDWLNCGGV